MVSGVVTREERPTTRLMEPIRTICHLSTEVKGIDSAGRYVCRGLPKPVGGSGGERHVFNAFSVLPSLPHRDARAGEDNRGHQNDSEACTGAVVIGLERDEIVVESCGKASVG